MRECLVVWKIYYRKDRCQDGPSEWMSLAYQLPYGWIEVVVQMFGRPTHQVRILEFRFKCQVVIISAIKASGWFWLDR